MVTIATDSFDRYPSVIEDLHKRELEVTDHVLDRWFQDVFMDADTKYILDTRGQKAKEALFAQKERDWLKFGYSKEYLDSMKKQSFWDKEYAKIKDYDAKIKKMRGKTIKYE